MPLEATTIYQAIEVKYLTPTNTLGSRWKASAFAGSVTVGFDYALSTEENALAAARALVDKLEWNAATLHGGKLKTGNYVFVIGE